MRAYVTGIYGALGALLGVIFGQIAALTIGSSMTLLVLNAAVSASIGGGIGMMLALAVSPRFSVGAALTGFIGGGLIGAGAGLGAEFILTTFAFGQPLLLRGVLWGVFGLLVGFVIGTQTETQGWKLSLGGLIGGFVGGAIQVVLQNVSADPTAASIFAALGSIITGFAIGLLAKVADATLRRAWLEHQAPMMDKKKAATAFLWGKIPDMFTLDKALSNGEEVIIGSSLKELSKAEISMCIEDPSVDGKHASLRSQNRKYFELTNYARSGETYVNGRRINGGAPLNHGDTIRFGGVEYKYLTRGSGESADTGTRGGTTRTVTPPAPTKAPAGKSRINVKN